MISRVAYVALATCALLTACGACGDLKRIDPKTVSPSQRAADMAIVFGEGYLDKTSRVYGSEIEFELDKLVKHPEAANVFVALGYVRRDGNRLSFTKSGLANSHDLNFGSRSFRIERPHHWVPAAFTYQTEQVDCSLGHPFYRTFGYDYPVGPLTTLGSALHARGLLYRGDAEQERLESPVRWKGPSEPLHEVYEFDANDVKDTRYSGGESLDFRWGTTFDSAFRKGS